VIMTSRDVHIPVCYLVECVVPYRW